MKALLSFSLILYFSGMSLQAQSKLNRSDNFVRYIKEGLIDESKCGCKYLVQDRGEIDGPSIVDFLLKSNRSLLENNTTHIEDEISALELKGSTIKKLFYDDQFILNSDLDLKSEAVRLAILKDYIIKSEVKDIFYSNSKSKQIFNILDYKIKDKYYSNEANVFSLFDSFIGFKALNPVMASNKYEIGQIINNFFSNTLKVENVELSFEQTESHYKIKSKSEEYLIPITAFINLFNGSLNNTDNVCLQNECFYSILIDYVKQIAADNESRYTFSIINPLNDFIDNDQYSNLINQFPFLKIKHSIYLQKMKKSDYDPFGQIGFSFLDASEGNNKQLHSYKLFIGDVDAGRDYLKTQSKKEFYSILLKYRDELKLNDSDLAKINYNITQLTSDNVIDFLNLIDGIGYSQSRIPYKSDVTVIINNKSFEEVFPKIYSWVKDDFGIKNLNYNIITSKISFIRKNKEYKIDFNERAMIDFIYRKDYITKENKYIHIPSDFGSFNTNYYLLTDELSEELQSIFGNVFEW